MTPFFCCDEHRRDAVRNAANFNGIDFLEVLDSDAPTRADRQRILRLHFLKPPAPPGIVPGNVVISGGERITSVLADKVSYDGDVVVVHLTAYGDYSSYRLQLVKADGSTFDPSKLDPMLSAIDFSFKVECPSDFDCAAAPAATAAAAASPEINYLAKDYASYRQLMFDRLAALIPQWQERNAADLGVTLVEMLAYVADQLSYRQDAVATEAYLDTARRRVSVRRHARLVDYFMHEGKNARALLHVEVSADVVMPKGAQLLTAVAGQGARLSPDFTATAPELSATAETFETMYQASLFRAHNRIPFYTWGNGRCFLPKGATSASLKGQFPNLAPGNILIFQEVIGPQTGKPEDADRSRRHAVRLTKVTASADPIGGAFLQPATTTSVDVTDIEWSSDDALPFAFTISARVTSSGGEQVLPEVSVARGNIVLADHGSTDATDDLGEVPAPSIFWSPAASGPCATSSPRPVPPRFKPRLKSKSLTYAHPYEDASPPASATAALQPALAEAIPLINLVGTLQGKPDVIWTVRRDLLGSKPDAPDFVVETESDGTAFLRFGDDMHGQRPTPGTKFSAKYRVGGGTRGNVGAEAISHAITSDPAIQKVANLLPAMGGIAPESIEDVRRKAPFAFRTQARAVTADDYETLVGQHPQVQRAAATFRWTGSWSTVLLTVDRLGGKQVDAAFAREIRNFVEPFRLAGHDLEVDGPNFVPLEIEARVSVAPDNFRSDVGAALLQVFSDGVLPDGQRGVFHPDNFTFGQPVYLSPLYAAAQKVDGVVSVRIVTFQRQGRNSTEALDKGKLELGRLEIAQLDNNPDFPERGVFRLTLEGGK
jgi:Baseplate J-like protein